MADRASINFARPCAQVYDIAKLEVLAYCFARTSQLPLPLSRNPARRVSHREGHADCLRACRSGSWVAQVFFAGTFGTHSAPANFSIMRVLAAIRAGNPQRCLGACKVKMAFATLSSKPLRELPDREVLRTEVFHANEEPTPRHVGRSRAANE
jgi:hypothetical protein